MTQKVTGWMNTDATTFCKCPRCGEEPGKACRTPKGKVTGDTHGERVGRYGKTFPERDGMYKGGPNGLTERRRDLINAFNAKVEQ